MQIHDSNDNKLSYSDENKDLALNCLSLGLCKHKRSASFDFRTLGNISLEVGGRQSWSGPVDDSAFACRSHICSSQSTSNIHAMDSAHSAFTNQNNLFRNFKTPESCSTSCNSVEPKDGDSQNIIYPLPGAYGDMENSINTCEKSYRHNKCLCPEPRSELCTSNGPDTDLKSKTFCKCRDSL